MSLRFQLERLAQWLAELCIMLWPRAAPDAKRLEACRLVSHRGEHDKREIRENTLAAFAAAAAAGAWGIEFDLRWTRDLEPVVIHDADTQRVFGVRIEVAGLEFDQLRRRLPEIPHLREVVEGFGGERHMMIELKRDELGRDDVKAERLERELAALRPGQDYHFLALAPDLFAPAFFAGRDACLLVAELNVAACSATVAAQGLGGLCGHYLLLGRALLEKHQRQGQKIGVGFPASRFALYREISRGADWIFTNHARRLGRWRRDKG